MNAQSLWNHVSNVGYVVRKNGFDGLKMWQPFKDFYSQYEIAGYEQYVPINENIKQLTKQINYFSEDVNHEDVVIKINNIEVYNSNETDHFIIQHFRIPSMMNRLPLVKILQIAYNVGQARAEFEKETYNGDIRKFYTENKLSEISTFIPQEISRYDIVSKSSFGGYDINQHKYKKYKTKYLSLKNAHF